MKNIKNMKEAQKLQYPIDASGANIKKMYIGGSDESLPIRNTYIATWDIYKIKPHQDDTTFSLSEAYEYTEVTWSSETDRLYTGKFRFQILLNFESQDPITVLDLTWLGREDIFWLDASQGAEWESIKEVDVNIDNLREYSYLPKELSSSVKLVVFNNNSTLKFGTQIQNFEQFISKHANLISSGIELVGFSIIRAKRLERIASKYGVPIRVPQEDKGNKTSGHCLRKIFKRNTSNQ